MIFNRVGFDDDREIINWVINGLVCVYEYFLGNWHVLGLFEFKM